MEASQCDLGAATLWFIGTLERYNPEEYNPNLCEAPHPNFTPHPSPEPSRAPKFPNPKS